MADPPLDNGTEDNGDDSGRPVPPPVPLKTQASPKYPQQNRENDWMASDSHQSNGKLDMDGDEFFPVTPSRMSPPGLAGPTGAAQTGTTTGSKPGAERLVRGDRPDLRIHSFSKSGGSTSERPEAPMVNDESGLRAALVDEMKAHPDEGPFDSGFASSK
ncbi:unnamed protein product [Peronospora effusa]|nr:unnamed protein product [Peronospora effusa]